ncbi:sugar MFS transporter [Methylobacterium aerolatum]|uniref:FHS family L-fucose permease-like MFS transporter n=1 Tax=Methylobacterium aerolatum TaxID=418708 RepID=A0ABU0I0A7_9HYPH|nr:sugar MFS transporter [Methylobacterium aerolatum]MDQ0448020.1 FHS family L-fucose permease-like MFS transporter [Methylobacterium aerolatum]GJD36509.1 L-fucose-proton symporter [Methylobacterium aerolatum]
MVALGGARTGAATARPHGSAQGSVTETRAGWLLPLMLALFFTWGLATVLVDIITPKLKSLFALSYAEATLTQFCFFLAYAVISLPAGALVARIGYLRGLVLGLLVMAAGSLMFTPAARIGVYPLFLAALFVMASGIAVLQVAANPLVTGLGAPESAPSRLTLAQTFNSLGTTVGPAVGAWAILSRGPAAPADPASLTPQALEAARLAEAAVLQTPFLVIAGGLAVLAGVFWALRHRMGQEGGPDGAERSGSGIGLDLLRRPRLAFGALAIFLYVGAEVSIGTLMVSYLEQRQVLAASPETAGHLLSFYWGGALVGRIVGSLALRRVRGAAALAACALAAGGLATLSALTGGVVSGWSLLAVGLANAILFPTIFAMAIEGLGPRTAQGAGIVCVAIVGGAVVPVITGALADRVGLQAALAAPIACYACIALYGFVSLRGAKPEVATA